MGIGLKILIGGIVIALLGFVLIAFGLLGAAGVFLVWIGKIMAVVGLIIVGVAFLIDVIKGLL